MTKLNLNKTLFCYKTTKFQPHKNLCFNNIQSLFPYMFTQYVYQVEKYHSYKKSFQAAIVEYIVLSNVGKIWKIIFFKPSNFFLFYRFTNYRLDFLDFKDKN